MMNHHSSPQTSIQRRLSERDMLRCILTKLEEARRDPSSPHTVVYLTRELFFAYKALRQSQRFVGLEGMIGGVYQDAFCMMMGFQRGFSEAAIPQ